MDLKSRYSTDVELTLLKISGLSALLREEYLADLKLLYSRPGRVYHNWDHVLDVLRAILDIPLSPRMREMYSLAALFHDAVYEVGSDDNENRSALLLQDMCHGRLFMTVMVGAASELILLTRSHISSTVDSVPPLYRDFMDCDLLSMSSRSWETAVQYDYAVCAEMVLAGQSEKDIVRSRALFLKTMLAKPSIYIGEYYGPRNEWYARQNLQKMIRHVHDFSQLKGQ